MQGDEAFEILEGGGDEAFSNLVSQLSQFRFIVININLGGRGGGKERGFKPWVEVEATINRHAGGRVQCPCRLCTGVNFPKKNWVTLQF